MDVFLNKNINYNNNELAVILALNHLQSDKHKYLCTSINHIAYILTDRLVDCSGKNNNTFDRSLCTNIKAGLDSLVKREFIKIDKQDKSMYVINATESAIYVDTKKVSFVSLELWEIHTIFNFKSTLKNILNLLSFFTYLVGTVNNKTKEWHSSQDQLVESYGCSKTTINNYLEQLEKLKLIYVHRSNKRRSDGTFHNINNSYGRYQDKDRIKLAANQYISTIETEDIINNLDRRSIKLRYNAFVGGSKKYLDNSELVNELYKECLLYNKSLEYKPIEDKDNEFKPKEVLDLSEFEQYGLYNPLSDNSPKEGLAILPKVEEKINTHDRGTKIQTMKKSEFDSESDWAEKQADNPDEDWGIDLGA